jgi:membrane-bound lytic murein transglycosylase D
VQHRRGGDDGRLHDLPELRRLEVRLRPPAANLRLLTFGLALVLAAAALPSSVAAQSAAAPSPPVTSGAPVPSAALLPRYAELQRDVDFWIRIYSQVPTRGGLLHDPVDLSIVYGEAAIPPGQPGSPERRAAIEAARERWAAALRQAADAVEAGGSPTSKDALRALGVWSAQGARPAPAALREAAGRVRFQLGQSDRFRAGLERSGAWRPHIARTLAAAGLPAELIALPHVESSFDPFAGSKVGAAGLWQFMPATGKLYLRVDAAVDERYDPFRATEAAARLLAYNHRLLGSWPLALTAYNHGAAGMRRARDTMGTDDFAVIARRYRGPAFGFASRNFYPSFLAALTIDQDPGRFFPGVVRAPEAVHTEIALPRAVATADLQRVVGLPAAQLRELNPAVREAAWRGERPLPAGYRLRLPAQTAWTASTLEAALGSLKGDAVPAAGASGRL